MKSISLLLGSLLLASVSATVYQPAETCSSCVHSATPLLAKLKEVTGNPRSLTKLQQEICGAHPAAGQRQCWELLQRGVPALSRKLIAPAQTCADLGLCSKAEALLVPSYVSGDFNCPLCEYLVVLLKEQLQDPDTEEEVIAKAEEVCKDLPAEAQSTCLQFVAQYGKQIFAWVHSADPESVCTMAGMCDQSARLSELPVPLQVTAASMLAIGDDDQCNTCQLVIIEASSVLSDPDTQKQILAYVKQSCKDFQSFEDQCETYVDLYGPLILNMAKQYLKPEICTQLGFCSTGRADATFYTA